MAGLRYNEGKRRWGLLSWPALTELVKVLEMGAKKYDSWNWSKGFSYTETYESLFRHLSAWYTGEDKDPESGLSHMAHVLCNAMFLMHFILFGTGTDDRPAALRQEKNNNDGDTTRPSNPVEPGGLSDVPTDVLAPAVSGSGQLPNGGVDRYNRSCHCRSTRPA